MILGGKASFQRRISNSQAPMRRIILVREPPSKLPSHSVREGLENMASCTPGASPTLIEFPAARGLYEYRPQGPDEIAVEEGALIELTDGISGGQNYAEGWWEGMWLIGRALSRRQS